MEEPVSKQDTHGILQRLADLDARGRAFALDLSGDRDNAAADLLYVDFQLCGLHMLCAMSELNEVIYPPHSITRVPAVQKWIRGVANVRGSLLPIVDLQAFVCGDMRTATADTRVMVAQRGDIHVGLQVPAVSGIKHVSSDMGGGSVNEDISSVREFVNGGYEVDGEVKPVFSMSALLEHPRFRVASV